MFYACIIQSLLADRDTFGIELVGNLDNCYGCDKIFEYAVFVLYNRSKMCVFIVNCIEIEKSYFTI